MSMKGDFQKNFLVFSLLSHLAERNVDISGFVLGKYNDLIWPLLAISVINYYKKFFVLNINKGGSGFVLGNFCSSHAKVDIENLFSGGGILFCYFWSDVTALTRLNPFFYVQ